YRSSNWLVRRTASRSLAGPRADDSHAVRRVRTILLGRPAAVVFAGLSAADFPARRLRFAGAHRSAGADGRLDWWTVVRADAALQRARRARYGLRPHRGRERPAAAD